MPRKKTNEEFVEELSKLNKNIIPNETYKGSMVKMKFTCTIHNYCWEARPDSILSGKSHCPICSGFIRTKESFINDFKKIDNSDNIEIIGEYKGMHKKIKVKCKIDNFEWDTTPHSLLQGHGCRECQRRMLSNAHFRSSDSYYKEANDINPNIEILSDYNGMRKKIKVKCKIHNYEYYTYPSSVLKGCGCKYCRIDNVIEHNTKSNEIFIKQLKDKYNDEVECLDEYVNDKTPLRFKHNCGHVFLKQPTQILQNLSCPNCNKKSKLEDRVLNLLNKNNITYKHDYRISRLRGTLGRLLSYDFFLLDYNLLIECQGIQHEKPIEHFGGIKQFKIQQEHDRRKIKYAKDHNIELLEIWYYDLENIEKILNEKLHIVNNNKESA